MYLDLKDLTQKVAVNEDLILDLGVLIKVEKVLEQTLMKKSQNTVKLSKIRLRNITKNNLRSLNSI